ncbi:MAG: class I SAM-dependent methyltransferase [Deltaproteobacteria bacterium]|nr:class I SAM-dependent methyltransferase [Deltaproteobacteria bacterium]
MHQSSFDKMSKFRETYLAGREREPLLILDLGSMDVNGSYRPLFVSDSWQYKGIDLAEGRNVDIVLPNPYDWTGIESTSVDVVVSGQAFEHIEYFWLTMLEIARVLKPGGLCCIIAPSGGFEHRYPVDCWRFYSDGFSALGRFAGLEVLDAYTQKENLGYKDDSDTWKDSVIICRKPARPLEQAGLSQFNRDILIEAYKVTVADAGQPLKVDFNPIEHPRSFFEEPQKLSDIASWHEHMPFAFLVMDILKPRVFVELGVHKGDSYLAFCQAVKNFGIDAKCHGVDTWKGEEHAGFYDESVYNQLTAYHDPLYGNISTLLKMTFDEALAKFADKSIDLLHIDGLHSYQAVKHDFEAWLPKMSDSGVILFHDTNVRERDFGVWRLWYEIKDKYPSMEFKHGHGLGVLAVGRSLPQDFVDMLAAGKVDNSALLHLMYLLGSRNSLKYTVASRDRELVSFREKSTALENRLKAEEEKARNKDKEIASFREKSNMLESQLKASEEKIKAGEERTRNKDREIASLREKSKALENRLTDILHSKSWQVTVPLRAVGGLFTRKPAKR